MKIATLVAFIVVAFALVSLEPVTSAQNKDITVRTENFPRPPYSGATYYIYEREGDVICTKLEVCNKFGNCDITYRKGAFKDEVDVETGEPYGTTKPVIIRKASLRKHVCLTRFKLLQ